MGIAAGSAKVRFKWQFLSEEFKEMCGAEFQDEFTVKVVVGAAEVPLFKVQIDDICYKAEYNKFLSPADVAFDQGGVYTSGWYETTVAEPNLAIATQLIFAVSTSVDAAYDTVVLVDDIAFLP